MVAECLGESDPNVGHAVTDERQEVELEEFIENLLLLHHLTLAHEHKELAFLESARPVITRLDHADDTLLLLWQVIKLFDDVSHRWAGIMSYTSHRVRAELEQHWQELGVNCLVIKQLGIVTQILRKHEL